MSQARISNITITTVITVAVSARNRTLNLIFPRCSVREMWRARERFAAR